MFEALEARSLLSSLGTLDQFEAGLVVDATVVDAQSQSASLSATASATALDSVQLGDTNSETAHLLTSVSSQVITGGLGQTARQLLPLATVDVNGGSVTVTLAVDPESRNYFTVKLWGSDDVDQGMGRLYLYAPVNGVNYEIGYRHEGDYAPLSVTAGHQPLPGRFFYSTTLLPLWLTQGKTTVTLTIQSTGELYGLGSGGPPSGNYQFNMDTPSRAIYAAYTHTQPMLDVSSELQGSAPISTTRPAVSDTSILGTNGTYTLGLKNWVLGKLSAANNTFTTSDVQMLANSFSISAFQWTAAQQSAIVSKVIAVIDGFASDYFTNPSTSVSGSSGYGGAAGNEVWGGRFGLLGWAIHLLSNVSDLTSQLDVTANYGSAGGDRTRRAAWGDMLLASRDYGRFNRRTITNQAILGDFNIYKANRALLDLGNVNAFTETQGLRYLKEAAGILAWSGNDLPGGGSEFPWGHNYYQVTPDGLTREWGYAGAYSEMAVHVAMMFKTTGDAAFGDQAVKMSNAIAHMRRPSVELSGGTYYNSMERVGLLAWRGVREADGYFADEIAYGGSATWSAGMLVAGATLDPAAVGYAKQMLADNQYLNNLISDTRFYRTLSFDSLYAFEPFADYYAVLNAPDSGIRLPTSAGQPDFVWSDETNGLSVVKHGGETLWVEPYWQAKTGTGVNGIGRFYLSAGNYEQYGVFETNPQFDSDGSYFVRPNFVDMPEKNGYVPPDAPTQAYAGEQLPIAASPSDATDDMPFRGKVNFYAFRFGKHLFGINVSNATTYTLKTPVGFTSAMDLSTGTLRSGAITVAPSSTSVLLLEENFDAQPVPTTPLLLRAVGASAGVSLSWSAASGATSYTIKRSATHGGTYSVIASGLGGTNFIDATTIAGSTYHYVVVAVNANGESYDSMDAGASAGLPANWTSTDLGSVALAGNAVYNDGAFTLNGSGGDIGGSADSGQFTYFAMSGDGTITARLLSTTQTNNADKVGLMIRASTAAGSQQFAALLDLSMDQVRTAYRASTNGSTTWSSNSGYRAAPIWLRIVRAGNTFTVFSSTDGATWTQGGSATIAMGTSVLAGMVVCSRYSQQTNASTFDNITINGWTAVSQPTAPASLTAIGTNATQVDLTWSSVAGATSYFVKRATTSDGPFTTIASNVTATSFVDTDVAAGTTYYYTISAFSSGGEGAYATQATATPVNHAPTLVAPITATANPVSGNSTTLSVLGADDDGAVNLNYTWTVTGPVLVSLSSNNSNTASTTTATFTTAGDYLFTATITDAFGLSTITSMNVTVSHVLTSIMITPGSTTLNASGTQQFTANAFDQFTHSMPASVTWTATGGAISASGLYTAGNTSGSFNVTASSGAVSGGAAVTIVAPPSIFTGEQNIGSVTATGSTTFVGGIYTVKGAGTDVIGRADALRLVYLSLPGDGQLVARVTSVQNTGTSAKAGLMIRSTLDAGSVEGSIFLTSTSGAVGRMRSSTNANTTGSTVAGIVTPYWLKIVRSGKLVQSYYSANGSTWTRLRSDTLNINGAAYIGLAVASGSSTTLCTATFDNVTLTNFTNRAQGKATTSSSTANGSTPANATDGSTSTAWTSAAAGSQWLQVDLGSVRNISRLTLNWGTNYAKSFSIRTSLDGVTWTTQSSTNSGTGAMTDIAGLAIAVRYLRVSMTISSASSYAITELQAIGE